MFNTPRLPKSELPVGFMYNVISTEALSVHKPIMATVQKLSGFIHSVAQGFKNTNVLGAIDTLMHKDAEFSKNERKVLEVLGRNSYTDLMDTRLPCIGGLAVTWIDFIHDLEPGINYVVNFYDGTLGETTRFLAEVITSPEKLDAISRRYNIQPIDFQKMTQDLGKDLRGGSKKAEATFGKLVKRNADMIDVITLTNRFSEQIYSSNQDMVTERIAMIKRQLETISEAIVDANSSYRMTGKNVDQLAKVAYTIAQSVEYYGVVLSVFSEHRRSFEAAIQKLSRIH